MAADDETRVDRVRAFNRFYTGHVGALDESMLESGFTLAEARVLYELDRHPGITAGDLARGLRIDPAYLSRLLKRFREGNLVEVERDPADARRQRLTLTAAGRKVYEPLEAGSRERVAQVLAGLSEAEQQRLLSAMQTIGELLRALPADPPEPAVLRPCRHGEAAQVLERAVSLFWQEQRWAGELERDLASLVAGFLARRWLEREALLVVERGGGLQGAALLLDEGEALSIAFFFLLPAARGQGLGRHLLRQATAFARAAGYRNVRVSSEAALHAAAVLLRAEDFDLVKEEPLARYGKPLLRQFWERAL
ncbi:MAG: bifunctional helix-turn-helix transcriptional regulator/GNAT family N-acetyltransferase [Kiloniellales bacterium]